MHFVIVTKKSKAVFISSLIAVACVFLDLSSPSSVPLEWPPKLPKGVRYHTTGCARSEGFYVISKKDKLHYLRHTHSALGDLTADTQVGVVSKGSL